MNNLEYYDNTEVFDINSLSKYLGCSAQTIRVMIRENKIPTYRLGRKYFFRKASIDEWLCTQENKYKESVREKDMQETIKRINSL